MKKGIIVLIVFALLSGTLMAQSNSLRYPLTIGMGAPGTVTGGVLNLRGLTSGSVQLKVPAAAGTGTIFQFPATNGNNGEVLTTNGSGVLTWSAAGAGDMLTSDTASMLTPYINRADTGAMLTPYINRADTATMLANYALTSEITVATGISAADTASMLSPYIRAAEVDASYVSNADSATMLTNYATTAEVRGIINDSLSAYIAGAETGVALADSIGGTTGSYTSGDDFRDGMALKATPADVRGIVNDSIDAIFANERLIFAPVIGVGNSGDTIAFSYQDVIWGVKWNGDYTLVISKVSGVVYGTTPDIDIALLHDTNFRDATPTAVLSADLTITSTTTGSETTTFSSATIAPGQWIWIRIDQCTAQPTQCIINIYGHMTR